MFSIQKVTRATLSDIGSEGPSMCVGSRAMCTGNSASDVPCWLVVLHAPSVPVRLRVCADSEGKFDVDGGSVAKHRIR